MVKIMLGSIKFHQGKYHHFFVTSTYILYYVLFSGKFSHYEMSSFPETKAEKWVSPARGKTLVTYNRRQFSRVYPKGQRIDSSNYDPQPMWACGCQLLALNYQTPGRLYI